LQKTESIKSDLAHPWDIHPKALSSRISASFQSIFGALVPAGPPLSKWVIEISCSLFESSPTLRIVDLILDETSVVVLEVIFRE
jgi:hypothetical protein